MMYDEYVDRVTEVVTGIVQQAGDRNNVLVDLGKVEALLPRSEQVDGERYEQGSRIKAVITEVRSGHEGPAGDPVAARSRADPHALRARGSRDRRRPRRDPRRRPRAGLPLEDRRRVARPGRRPGRRVRRAARLARPHGRLRAARREDRHHPVEHRACALHREGALAGARAGGARRRRDERGDGHRPRGPARAGDRQGGPERPPRRAPDRLEGRHPVRRRVRPGRGRSRVRRRRRRRGVLRPLLAILANGKRCPNAAVPGSRFCGIPAHRELAEREAAARSSRLAGRRRRQRRGGSPAEEGRRRRRPTRSRAGGEPPVRDRRHRWRGPAEPGGPRRRKPVESQEARSSPKSRSRSRRRIRGETPSAA